jgi:predicted permease
MRALRRFLIRLGASATRRRDEERLREEVEEHLELQTAENVRAGMSPVEARRQAVLKFGAVEAVKEHYREQQGLPFLDTLFQDARYALRQLRKAPLFTVTATLSLAVGIGATAAIFTLVDRVLLRALPVSEPQELVFVADQRSPQEPSPRFSYPFYAALRDNTVLTGVAARFLLPLNTTINGGAARVNGELVSGNYFSVLGTGTQIGRALRPEDDRSPGAHAVAVISDGFWQRTFGSDPSALGQAIQIDRHTFTIIGVTAKGFAGTEVGRPTDMWLPMMMQKEVGRDLLTEARTNWLEIFGRLKPGTSLDLGGAELTAYIERGAGAANHPNTQSRRLILLPGGKGNSPVRRELGPALRVLLVLTALALVLACVNLASLLAVRSVAREKEIAVRLSLGATRSRLTRQFLTETLLLAALGGTGGLLIAPWAAGLLVASHPDRLGIDPSLDMRAFMFGFTTSVLTGMFVGLAPTIASRRVGLAQAGSSSSAARGTHRRLPVHDIIVTGQIAMSLAMLISAALLVQSLRNLSAVDVGVRADDLLLISVDPRSAGYDGQRAGDFWRDTLDRVRQIRGVDGVSLARTVPLAPGRQRQPLLHPTSGERIEIDINVVGPGYFRTLGIPLVRGHEFDERDGKTSRPVVIINERLAQLFWPGEDPIGKGLRTGRRPGSLAPEVVGVVKDVRYRNLRDDAVPMFYVPVFQTTSTDPMTLHVRAASDPGALAGTIRREMQSLDANVPLFGISTLEDQLNAPLAQPRQAAVLSGGFGILALVLSGIGVYGVTALAVGRQTRDIGIRMALGAQPRQIVRVVGRRGLAIVITGLGLGVLGSFGFTRLAGAMLYGIAARDTATFAGMAALLAVVSLTAIYIPARAATRLDAIGAIRRE